MYINKKFQNLIDLGKQKNNEYKKATPFPHIVIDNLFDEILLDKILNEFPENINQIGDKFDNKVEKKLSLNDTNKFSLETNNFINYLNSEQFINFLQNITNIEEKLVPDPYLIGGGLHELREKGYLNVHADFNMHPTMKLDRRLNLLIYLNKDWKNEYGGSLELWDNNMKNCEKKIVPYFNKAVIFSTTDNSFHGNPEEINHPNKLSRKSIAMYYYSNGRPIYEKSLGNHSTIFRKRPNSEDPEGKIEFKKLFGKIYLRKKNKIK